MLLFCKQKYILFLKANFSALTVADVEQFGLSFNGTVVPRAIITDTSCCPKKNPPLSSKTISSLKAIVLILHVAHFYAIFLCHNTEVC